MALLVAIKANAFALSFIALMASMSPPTAAYAMESLHFPSRLVFIFIFSLRFIHVIAQEWTTLTQAARLRGFRPKPIAGSGFGGDNGGRNLPRAREDRPPGRRGAAPPYRPPPPAGGGKRRSLLPGGRSRGPA